MHQGSCLCGAVSFRIHEALAPIQICHCGQCRKAQGGAFASNIPVAQNAFELLTGGEQLRAFESSPGKRRVFCGHCGSPIYSQTEKLPGVLRIRAGTLDGELPSWPEAHYYVASKANWWGINDGLPCFPGAKP